jgi:hypothetical protein
MFIREQITERIQTTNSSYANGAKTYTKCNLSETLKFIMEVVQILKSSNTKLKLSTANK